MFNFLLKTLDPEWAKPYMQADDMKKCREGVFYLSIYYLLQLALFRLSVDSAGIFKQLLKAKCPNLNVATCEAFDRSIEFDYINFYGQYYQIWGTIIGAVLGWLWLRYQRHHHWEKKTSIRSTLNWSFLIYTIAILGSAIWYYEVLEREIEKPFSGDLAFTFYVLRVFFGIGWACGIGGAVLWTCEYLPPYLRTSGAIAIGSAGFLGAAIAGCTVAPVSSETAFKGMLIVSGLIGIFGTIIFFLILPKDSDLNNAYEDKDKAAKNSGKKPNPWKSIFEPQKLSKIRIVVSCLLIGTTVQFFSFYIRVANTKISYSEIKEPHIYIPHYRWQPPKDEFLDRNFKPFRNFTLDWEDTLIQSSHWNKDSIKVIRLRADIRKEQWQYQLNEKDSALISLYEQISQLPSNIIDLVIQKKVKNLDTLIIENQSDSVRLAMLIQGDSLNNSRTYDHYKKISRVLSQIRYFRDTTKINDAIRQDLKTISDDVDRSVELMPKDRKDQLPDPLIGGIRYFGMFLAGFPLVRLAYMKIGKGFYRKRLSWLLIFLLSQFVFMVIVLCIWKYYYEWYAGNVGILIIVFLSGFLGSTWIPALLATAEQFSLRDRPIWVLLAPDFYRLADVILLSRTGRVETYSGDQSIAIFLWGLIFTVLAIVAALSMEENFEGDALHHPSDENLSTPKLRKEIRNCQGRPLSEYMPMVNEVLFENFKKILKEQVYSNNIFYKDGKDVWKFAGFNVPNDKAYKVYRRIEREKPPIDPHLISNKLWENGDFEAFTKSIAEETKVPIGIVWHSERQYDLYQNTNQGRLYKVINLANIEVLEMKKYVNDLEQFKDKDQADDLVKQFKGINADEKSFKYLKDLGLFKGDEPRNRKLLKMLAFFRVDAELHFPGRYFIHVVKPYSENPEVMLILKTVVPLSEKRLEDLRSLVTFIESGKIKKELRDNEWKRITEEQSHSFRHTLHYLKEKSSEPDILAQTLQPALNYLSDVNNFNTALVRAGDTAPSTWSYDMKNLLERKPSALPETIKEILDELYYSLDVISFAVTAHRDLVRKLIQEMKEGNTEYFEAKHLSYCIKVVPVGWRIVLTDLLKNAFKHTYYKKPEVFIRFEIIEDHYRLSVINNQVISQEDFNKFEDRLSGQRLGIRTIDRILGFKYFTEEGCSIETAKIDPSSTDKALKKTIIYLTIPKQIVSKYEQV